MSIDQEPREITLFERRVEEGDAGLVGMDGSGNEWEFSENIGSVAVGEEVEL